MVQAGSDYGKESPKAVRLERAVFFGAEERQAVVGGQKGRP
jgi:hypothetical protein